MMRSQSSSRLRFTTFDELRSFIDQLQSSRTSTTGKWSLGQIAYHLAGAVEMTCACAPARQGRWRRWLMWPFRTAVLRFGPPRGVSIPAEIQAQIDPPVESDASQQLARLRRSLELFERAQGPPPAHPKIGPLTRREWGRFHLRHAELHLRYVVVHHDGEGQHQ